jgi:Leucine-rich repeat (LRR) protein
MARLWCRLRWAMHGRLTAIRCRCRAVEQIPACTLPTKGRVLGPAFGSLTSQCDRHLPGNDRIPPETEVGFSAIIRHHQAMGELKQHFSLWRQGLGVVPDEVWLMTDLQTLVLADNDLTEISERVGDLSRLRMLDLGHNKLRELPCSIGHLEELSDFLYLHDNRLTQLPDSLSRLQRLRYLNISESAFEVFPEVVTALRSLSELRVTDNRLTHLPHQSRG